MKTKFLLLFILAFTFGACKKNVKQEPEDNPVCNAQPQECDSCLFYLSNKTAETIWFGMGSNMLDDSLSPGQTKIFKGGRVKVTINKTTCERNRSSWSTGQLHSEWGDWAFDLDHCKKRSNFEYDKDSLVKLVDVTVY